MKNLWTMAICACMSLVSISAAAQNIDNLPINEPNLNKPKLFQGMPDKFAISQQTINTLFAQEEGRTVSINLSDAPLFHFEGIVISSVTKDNDLIRTIMIRSTNFPGARLYVARSVDERGISNYTGRILSMEHGDMYELKSIDNQMVLVKKKFYDLVNE